MTHSYTEQHIDSEFKRICRRQDRDEMIEVQTFTLNAARAPLAKAHPGRSNQHDSDSR
jgi:hypothetical protein